MADNLLDKASILLTPTAYRDGGMLSVKPNENLYGSELVTNGDFSNGLTSWSAYGTTSVSSGVVTIGASANSGIFQGILTQGKKYKVTINVTSYDGVGNAQVINDYGNVLHTITTTGLQTFYFEHSISNVNIIIRATQNGVLSVSSFSVVEDLSGDFQFSRSSAATRVNAQGLVENVQIISSELVSNGNFSQIGTEEVSNGNFSQEGSELVTNGDFATDSDWTFTSGWSISDGKLIANNATSIAYQGISAQPNKSYKVTFTVSSYTSGNVKIQFLGGSNSGTPRTSTGTFTEYITLDGSANGNFAFSRTQNFTGSIDNISVKEVGQDWNLGTGWSIGDGVASCDGTQTGWSILQQNNILPPDGSIVKIVANVSNYSSGNLYIKAGFGDTGFQISSDGTFTTYRVVNGSSQFRLQADLNFNGSITNISVKEVGQDWTFGSGASMGDGKVVADGTGGNYDNIIYQDTNVSFANKKFKIKFDVLDYASGKVRVSAGNSSVTPHVEANGSYEFISNVSVGNDILYFINYQVPFVGSITNISVKEITDDTDLPRINYEGFSYQDSLGSEEVVNGTFDSDTSWNKGTGWSIANGKASKESGVSTYLLQSMVLPTPNTYKVTFTVSDYTSGDVKWGFTSTTASIFGTPRTANGTYTEYFTHDSNTIALRFRASSTFQGSIDNVSVKEYLGQEVVPDSGCGSWLLEPQSTNLVTYSEDLSDSSWLKASSGTASIPSVTSNYSVSPDGTLNASRVVFDLNEGTTSSDFSQLQHNISSTSGLSHTSSVYMKSNNDNTYNLTFIPVSGSTTIVSVTPQWKRFDLSANLSSSNMRIRTRGSESSSDVTDISIWGAQLEQQSYATSYIPTNGAASTRLQDIANNSGNSTLINSTEGVLYAEIAALADDVLADQRSIQIEGLNGSSNNEIIIQYISGDLRFLVYGNSTLQLNTSQSVSLSSYTKVALLYKNNVFKIYINGTERYNVSGSYIMPTNLNKLNFSRSGVSNFYGKNKALAVYKEALTDAELQSLTTI